MGLPRPSHAEHKAPAVAQYRFNRRFNLSIILKRLLRDAALTQPAPGHRIRMAEVHT